MRPGRALLESIRDKTRKNNAANALFCIADAAVAALAQAIAGVYRGRGRPSDLVHPLLAGDRGARMTEAAP